MGLNDNSINYLVGCINAETGEALEMDYLNSLKGLLRNKGPRTVKAIVNHALQRGGYNSGFVAFFGAIHTKIGPYEATRSFLEGEPASLKDNIESLEDIALLIAHDIYEAGLTQDSPIGSEEESIVDQKLFHKTTEIEEVSNEEFRQVMNCGVYDYLSMQIVKHVKELEREERPKGVYSENTWKAHKRQLGEEQ
jgi:hypothetical protein